MLDYNQTKLLEQHDKLVGEADRVAYIHWINNLPYFDCRQLIDAINQRKAKK